VKGSVNFFLDITIEGKVIKEERKVALRRKSERRGNQFEQWRERKQLLSRRFPQRFTSAFFVQNFGTKNYKAVFWV